MPKPGAALPKKSVIWIVNPFDQLPNETDVPLRYWSLCRSFAQQGHEVIWWSSDFSHLYKKKRQACPDTDGFSVRLIASSPYTKNISFARLKNHRQFAQGFYHTAISALESGQLSSPDRIVISLPPLGVAEQAFRIRDWVNQKTQDTGHKTTERSHSENGSAATPPSPLSNLHSSPPSQQKCQVIVDIMDAWPETFYRALPHALRSTIGPILLAPMHRSAQRAYKGADKISAVGQNYLNLAQQYLTAHTPLSASAESTAKAMPPQHLCYHGTELERFAQKPSHPSSPSAPRPLQAVYLGAMGLGYDLITIVKVAARWQAEGQFPVQIHFAGTGPQLDRLKAISAKQGLTQSSPLGPPRIIYHGQLGRAAVNQLLLSSNLALVPNRPGSLVACPYKAGEYAAAGLPMLSCLGGELGELIRTWNAGSEYKEGDADSLHAAFGHYLKDPKTLKNHAHNARQMAEALFDRSKTYRELIEFICKE